MGEVTGGQVGGSDGAVEVELAGPGVPLSGGWGGAGVVERMPQPSSLRLMVGMVASRTLGWWRRGQLRINV